MPYNDDRHNTMQTADDGATANLPGFDKVRLFLAAWLMLARMERDVVAWKILHPTAALSQYAPNQRHAGDKVDQCLRRAAKKSPIIARMIGRRPFDRDRT